MARYLPCDRKIVERCIRNWFGSVQQFEEFAAPLLRSTFDQQLGQDRFPYSSLADRREFSRYTGPLGIRIGSWVFCSTIIKGPSGNTISNYSDPYSARSMRACILHSQACECPQCGFTKNKGPKLDPQTVGFVLRTSTRHP